jgi:Domain of unknown function (DUF397)
MDDAGFRWVKSSYSSSGNCVELASQAGRVLVRDTNQAGTGPVVAFGADAWRRFVGQLKASS